MKKLIITLAMVLVIAACSNGGFVNSLEKQYQNLESYTSQYTVKINETEFAVHEQYNDKGKHHIIEVVTDKGYQQSIELDGDKVKLKNINNDNEIVGERAKFNYPVFVLVNIMEEIIAKKDTIKIIDKENIEINNGKIIVTHINNKLTKVILNIQDEIIIIEYDDLQIK